MLWEPYIGSRVRTSHGLSWGAVDGSKSISNQKSGVQSRRYTSETREVSEDWWWTKVMTFSLWRSQLGETLPSTALVITAEIELARVESQPTKMADMDVFAAMGIAGFGKASTKKKLDPARFDKNKREVGIESILIKHHD